MSLRRSLYLAAGLLFGTPALALAASGGTVQLEVGGAPLSSTNGLWINPSNLTIAQGSTTSGQNGDLVFGTVLSANPGTPLTAGDSYPLSVDTNQNLRVDLTSVGGTALALGQTTMSASLPVTIASNQSAIPVSGTFWQATQPVSGTVTANQGGSNWSQNLAQVNGTGAAALSDALGNPTAFAFGSYSLGWDSTNSVWRRVQVDAGTGTLKVDGSGATQPISGSVTANQGGAPWANNITQWDSTALGAPSAYGTSPGAVNVPGVNAYVTNSPTVNAGTGFLATDNSGFTAGTSGGSNINCFYQLTPTNNPLTSGNSGTAGCDQYRDLHVTATDSAGQPLLDKSAYRITGGPVSSFATSPTDWVVLTGSNTKTVRITNVTVCGLATTATSQPVEIVKRSTADSAGTSTTPSITPLDSGDAAATAAAAVYTANPTVGTQVGSPVDTFYLNLGATGSAGCASLDFGTRNDQALVLRGTTQQAAINLAGTTVPAGTNLTYRVEWTEGSTSD